MTQDIVGGSPRHVREALMSYLYPHSQSSSVSSAIRPSAHGYNANVQESHILTPPSSLSTPSVKIPLVTPEFSRRTSLPLTPSSSSGVPEHTQMSCLPRHNQPIPLLATLFPYHVSQVMSMARILEVVLPPAQILQGFIIDHPDFGRAAYVHLPSSLLGSSQPEALKASFSEVLRPLEPVYRSEPESAASLHYGLDMRESLTALMDLASDHLQASSLVLVLDRLCGGEEGMSELLHSLMYVGGQVLRPGGVEGGWEWDSATWVLVGMEM
jgi:hypothetical protein